MYPELLNRTLRLIDEHHKFSSECICLVASENASSPLARIALSSDLIQRYTYHGHYKAYEELEKIVEKAFIKLLGAERCCLNPVSGTTANIAAYMLLSDYNAKYMALDPEHGGHKSFMEDNAAGILRMKRYSIPFIGRDMRIDVDKTIKLIREIEPTLIILGATVILFPQPVKEIVEVAREVNAKVMFDAAHVFGLIIGGKFPNPIKDGVDVMTASTHKTFPGPQGGIIFYSLKYEEKLKKIVNTLFSNLHPNKLPSLAITLAEMITYGNDYARQIIVNAKTLAERLNELGVPVLCEHLGFTETHQVVIDASKFGGGLKALEMLRSSGILCTAVKIPIDHGKNSISGLRLGTAEVTRLGMKEDEMRIIAELIAQSLFKRKSFSEVKFKVRELKHNFNKVHYCFDSKINAYENFIKFIMRF